MPDPLIVRTMRQFKADLLAAEEDQMREMARRWLQVEYALEARISDLARTIRDLQAAGESVSPEKLYQMQRYQALLRQTRREIDDYAEYAERTITARQRELAGVGIEHAAQTIQAGYTQVGRISPMFDRLPIEAVEAMAGLAGDGSPLKALLANAYPDAVDGLTRALVRSTALGVGPRQTAKAMQYLVAPDAAKAGLADGFNRVLTIARTEQLRVYREASRQQWQASGLVSGFYRLATHDARTCAACLMAEGEWFPVQSALTDHVQGRCSAVPKLKGVPALKWEKGQEWFVKQDEDTQRGILGKGRFEAWKEGKFKLKDVVKRTTDPTWGGSLGVRPLRELIAG